ncbi:hypothetical protein AVEN_14114-1 [Araneus ventricosus]|uniref:CCHC-type domain-containing protein n=1 Tax=Araneus ventricosus TaxID=182803 RepID=A0A4Y2TNN9_ARAVE|nr:hypothetical protein AVEN_14114-1 [Araneus ventricosus]
MLIVLVRFNIHHGIYSSGQTGVISCNWQISLSLCKQLWKKVKAANGIYREFSIPILNTGNVTHSAPLDIANTPQGLTFFSSHVLAEYVKAGYIRLSVRPYISNPLRCFKCQRFGHSQTSCLGTLTCARCAEVGHESTGCTAKEKCVNCKDDHTSFSLNCLARKLEKEVVATKVKNQISYPEARKIVVSKAPTAGTSYASVAQKKSKKTNPPDIPIESNYLGKTATVPQSPHSISEQVVPLPSTSLVVENAPIPICDDASTSQDLTGPLCHKTITHSLTHSQNLTGFKTVTKKKNTKTQSEPTNVKQNEFHSESSKFWTTSPLQVSNSTIRQVITSLQSEDALKKTKTC